MCQSASRRRAPPGDIFNLGLAASEQCEPPRGLSLDEGEQGRTKECAALLKPREPLGFLDELIVERDSCAHVHIIAHRMVIRVMRAANERQLLDALDVGAGIGVDLDAGAFFEEERDLDDEAGLEGGGLGAAGGGIAFEAGVGLRDRQFH